MDRIGAAEGERDSPSLESHPDADCELGERERLDAENFPDAVSNVHVGPAGSDPDAGDELCCRPEGAFLVGNDKAIRCAEHDQHGIGDIAKPRVGNRSANVQHPRTSANVRAEGWTTRQEISGPAAERKPAISALELPGGGSDSSEVTRESVQIADRLIVEQVVEVVERCVGLDPRVDSFGDLNAERCGL